MLPEHRRFPLWLIVLVGAALALVLLLCRDPDPNAELVRMAGEAVSLAHEAQSDNRAAVLWAGRFRLIAVVIGVSAPLVIVYLLSRAASKSEIDAVELLDCVEKHALPQARPMDQPTLHVSSHDSRRPELCGPENPPNPPAD